MTIERPMFPPRADSVDSSLPQPAPDPRQTERFAGESPKPARGLSRRYMLAGLAVLPAVAGIPTSAAAQPDPIFAVIARHRALSAAYDVAVNHPGVGDDDPQFDEVNAICDEAMHACFDHSDRLFAFRPATVAGIAAELRYISTLEDWQLPGGFDEPETVESLKELCTSIADAIEIIIRQSQG